MLGEKYVVANVNNPFFGKKEVILVKQPAQKIAPRPISYPLSLGMNNTHEINSTNTIDSTVGCSCYDELVSLRDYIDMLIASCDSNGSGLVGSYFNVWVDGVPKSLSIREIVQGAVKVIPIIGQVQA